MGVALVIGSCLSLPFGAAVAAQLFPVLGPWGVTSLRVAIAAILLVVIVRPRPGKWTRPQWLAAVLFGVSLARDERLLLRGRSTASRSAPPSRSISSGRSCSAAVLDHLSSGGCRLGRLCALLGMVALGIDGLIGAEPLDPLGLVFILIAAGFWVMYIRMSARVGAPHPRQQRPGDGARGGGRAADPGRHPGRIDGRDGSAAAAGSPPSPAVLSSVIPYSFELAALRRLPQRVFGVLLSLEPAFATLAGWLILGAGTRTPLRCWRSPLVIAASVGATLGVLGKDRRDGGPSGPFTAPIPLPRLTAGVGSGKRRRRMTRCTSVHTTVTVRYSAAARGTKSREHPPSGSAGTTSRAASWGSSAANRRPRPGVGRNTRRVTSATRDHDGEQHPRTPGTGRSGRAAEQRRDPGSCPAERRTGRDESSSFGCPASSPAGGTACRGCPTTGSCASTGSTPRERRGVLGLVQAPSSPSAGSLGVLLVAALQLALLQRGEARPLFCSALACEMPTGDEQRPHQQG